MISFRYLSNDVIRPSASSHYYFPSMVSPHRAPFTFPVELTNLSSFSLSRFFCHSRFFLCCFFWGVIFELQVEFLLDNPHETWMTEYPLFWISLLHLDYRFSSSTELELVSRES